MYDVVAIGNALVDHEYLLSDEQLIQTGLNKGSMTLADESAQAQALTDFSLLRTDALKQTSGGSAANATYAFACLGGSTFYACQVGDDDAGQFYLADLSEAGVAYSLSHAIAPGTTTGTCIVAVTPDGERTMQTHLGTSADISDTNIDFSAIKQSNWLYLEGYLAMSENFLTTIDKLRQQAGIHDCKIAISFADPSVVNFAKQGLLNMIGNGVDVIFCNAQEAKAFTQKKQIKAAAKALTDYCKVAVVTNGGDDSIICHHQDGNLNVIAVTPTSVADVIDTNGAGDNYSGAFLYALNQHYDLKQCAQLAHAVSSNVVRQLGPRLTPAQYQDIAKQTLVV